MSRLFGASLAPEPRLLAAFDRTARGCATVAIAGALLALAGWTWDVVPFKSLAPGLAPIEPNAALGCLLAGLALWSLPGSPLRAGAPGLALACSLAVAALGFATLLEHLFGWDTGIDRLQFGQAVLAAGESAPGRMSAFTALLFALTGGALAALALAPVRAARAAEAAGALALALAATPLLGFAYDPQAVERTPFFAPLAPLAVLLLFLLSAALALAAATRAESSLLASPGAGGAMLRRLWPGALATLAILSGARLYGEKIGLYPFELGLALMVVLAAVVLTTLAWAVAARLDRLDAAQRRATAEARANESRLRGLVAGLAEGVVSLDADFRIVLFNAAAERMFGRSREEVLGRSLDPLIPERLRERHREELRKFAATGESARTMGRYGAIWGLRANGEEFPIEATISCAGEGGQRLYTVVLRDVSERQRMERVLRDYTEQLRRLSRELFEVQEAERRRLARELHDRIGQNVTALGLNLNLLRAELPEEARRNVVARLEDCETLLYATGQLVRDVMAELRPPGLDALGLVAALIEHARQVAARSGIAVTVSGTEPAPRLPPQSEIALFRIAQEALTNVVKHAGATEAAVALEVGPDRVTLTIADNGRGFDAAAHLARASTSMGLIGMRERAEAIGGRLRVESSSVGGTQVIVQAPRATPPPGSRRSSAPAPAAS